MAKHEKVTTDPKGGHHKGLGDTIVAENVIFEPTWGLAVQENGIRLEWSTYGKPKELIDSPPRRNNAEQPSIERLFVAYNNKYQNHYHLIREWIGSIFLFHLNRYGEMGYKLALPGTVLGVNYRENELIKNAIDMLRLGNMVIFFDQGSLTHEVKSLIYPRILSGFGHQEHLNFLEDYYIRLGDYTIKNSLLPLRSKEKLSISYINRLDSQKRRLSNECELAAMLAEEFSAKSYTFSQISIADQIDIFRNSDLIVAPHGAALANLLFRKAGSGCIIEIIPEDYEGLHFVDISNSKGLNHVTIKSSKQSKTKSQEPSQSEYLVDIEATRSTIKSLLTPIKPDHSDNKSCFAILKEYLEDNYTRDQAKIILAPLEFIHSGFSLCGPSKDLISEDYSACVAGPYPLILMGSNEWQAKRAESKDMLIQRVRKLASILSPRLNNNIADRTINIVVPEKDHYISDALGLRNYYHNIEAAVEEFLSALEREHKQAYIYDSFVGSTRDYLSPVTSGFTYYDSHLRFSDYSNIATKALRLLKLNPSAIDPTAYLARRKIYGDLGSKLDPEYSGEYYDVIDWSLAAKHYNIAIEGDELKAPLSRTVSKIHNSDSPFDLNLLIRGDSHSSIPANSKLTAIFSLFFRNVTFTWNPYCVNEMKGNSYDVESRQYDVVVNEMSERFLFNIR